MHIRQGIAHDIPVLAAFQKNMASETEGLTLDENILRQGLQALFSDPSKGHYYVAEDAGVVIGCLMVTYEWSDWRNGTVLWIQSVYIAPGYRGRGVYGQLYAHVQAQVRTEPGYRGIRLYVDKTNKTAQGVYEKLGMNGEHYQMYEWMKE
ncbi:MAG: GNAT family N-acetyltransferase [Cyclobacteriaceae bacterium]|jgi:ribosomal protein S18 acetylase RimI-like enzyme|nr:GNAT family N-acetyltransferase [Cyclobacteriaceae bacterium]